MNNKTILYIVVCLIIFATIIITNYEAGLFYNLITIIPGIILVIFLVKLSQPIDSCANEKQLSQEKEYERYLRKNGMDRKDFEAEIDKIVSDNGPGKISSETNKILEEKLDAWNTKEIDLCDEFIKNNPKNTYAIGKRAQLYNAIGRYYDAINDYRYLMKKEPKEVSHVQNCAVMYAKLNDKDAARLLLNNFYKKKKNDEYYAVLGKLFNNAEMYELAIENYTKAIEFNPKNKDYYRERACVYLKIGDRIKAQEDMKKSAKIREANYMALKEEYSKTEYGISTDKSSEKKFFVYSLIFVLVITFASSYMVTSPSVSNIVIGCLVTIGTFSICTYILVKHK